MATQWTANTAAEALNLLEAARSRIEAGLLAANPGLKSFQRADAARDIPLHLDITLDTAHVDQLGIDHGAFNAQILETS